MLKGGSACLMGKMLKPNAPRIIELPDQKMATIQVAGDPNVIGRRQLPALYETVWQLKKIIGPFRIGNLRVRYPADWYLSRGERTYPVIYGLPIPDIALRLPGQNKVLGVRADVEKWEYGRVAEVLHHGHHPQGSSAVRFLLDFVMTSTAYIIVGPVEEEYVGKFRTVFRLRLTEKTGCREMITRTFLSGRAA